jgi:hypothetical protein
MEERQMSTRRMRLFSALLPLCALLLAVPAAQAQETNLRASRARQACQAGNTQEGVALLAELFTETRDPNYIYNQGRCFERNGKHVEALLSFREYLRIAGDLPAAEKADVERHIAELQAASAAQEPPPPPVAEKAAATEVELPKTPAARQGTGLRTAGIVTASVGMAAVVAGVVFGLSARSIEKDVTSDNSRQTYDRNKDDRGHLYAKLQWVGYGVGGAALAGGALLYYFGYRAAQTPAALTLVPVLAPDRAGALLRGRF